MKTVNFILKAAALTLLLGGVTLMASAQNGKGFDAGLKQKIESRVFTIAVSQASPQKGRAISLNAGYYLRLKDGSVVSDLPYYGRAYTSPYGGSEGLRFEGKLTNYTYSYTKKNSANIKFDVRTGEDLYKFTVDIYSNGSSYIRVQPINKQGMSFRGDLE